MKTCFYYSIFSHDDKNKSIRYLVDLCRNIKIFENNKLYELDYYIKIHTDQFTLNIILDMLRLELIPMNNILFKIWDRNTYLKGMIWRFESFIDDEYDLTVNAEGDFLIEKYFSAISLFNQYHESCIYLLDVRQVKINDNWICGGFILIKPKMISSILKEKMKEIINAINNFDYIHYGIDEKALSMYIKTMFKDSNCLIIVDNQHNIFLHIIDVAGDIKYLSERFSKSTIISILEVNDKLNKILYYIPNTNNCNLQYMHNNLYILNNEILTIGDTLRVPLKQNKEEEILNIVKNILAV